MTIPSGTPVRSGTYWNPRRFTFARVELDGDLLRGGAGDRWVRVPLPLVIAAAPVLGGLFVVALPVIGAALVAAALARRIAGDVKDGAADLAANLAPGPLPGEAHLTGKPGEEHAGEPAKDATLEALEKDIAEKRRS